MTTKTEAKTRCDAPGCTVTNNEEEYYIGGGWARLQLTKDFGLDFARSSLDFCSRLCLMRWLAAEVEGSEPGVTP